MAKLIYLTGPVRSGKSRWAVEWGRAWGENVVFVATWRPARDVEMAQRVQRHREERPSWRTLEAPENLAAALAALEPPPSAVIVDCLTLWASDRLALADKEILSEWERELRAFHAAPWSVLVVGNEIGWSPVPEEPILRRFRDLVGTLGQRTASAAEEAWLLVAGCAVKLK